MTTVYSLTETGTNGGTIGTRGAFTSKQFSEYWPGEYKEEAVVFTKNVSDGSMIADCWVEGDSENISWSTVNAYSMFGCTPMLCYSFDEKIPPSMSTCGRYIATLTSDPYVSSEMFNQVLTTYENSCIFRYTDCDIENYKASSSGNWKYRFDVTSIVNAVNTFRYPKFTLEQSLNHVLSILHFTISDSGVSGLTKVGLDYVAYPGSTFLNSLFSNIFRNNNYYRSLVEELSTPEIQISIENSAITLASRPWETRNLTYYYALSANKTAPYSWAQVSNLSTPIPIGNYITNGKFTGCFRVKSTYTINGTTYTSKISSEPYIAPETPFTASGNTLTFSGNKTLMFDN